ncbi:hypothetical protein P153DRAFT_284244, partial [Dothidotthia symphoricarpi CBS 119687]
NTMSFCEECNKPGATRCSGCQSSLYCSKECQKKGWPMHRFLCKTLKDFQDRPVPSGSHEIYSRAIYFHPNETSPRFIWLKNERISYDGYTITYVRPRLGALIANNEDEKKSDAYVTPGSASFAHNHALDRGLTHTVFLRYRDTFLVDGSQPNKAINKVCDLDSRYAHEWRGPIVAYGTELLGGMSIDPKQTVDLAPSDLRTIVHFLNVFNCQGSMADGMQEMRPIAGVRINCGGDVEHGGRLKYEPVTVPAYHRIFEEPAAPISTRFGFPVTMQRVRGSYNRWNNGTMADGWLAFCNPAATYIYLGCDPKVRDNTAGPSWGFAPMKWQNSVGSVLLMRQDKKTLLPEHAAALSDYCQFHLTDLFQRQIDGEIGINAARILREITEEKFKTYYETWKEDQDDEEKRTQISPYEV